MRDPCDIVSKRGVCGGNQLTQYRFNKNLCDACLIIRGKIRMREGRGCAIKNYPLPIGFKYMARGYTPVTGGKG